MRNERIFDVDQIVAAVDKARHHAAERGKPLNLARIALYLGQTSNEFEAMICDLDEKAKQGDERAQTLLSAIKNAKQESRADLEDCLADKGNTTGYIFLGKVNHGMVETTRQEIDFKGVIFEGEENVPD